MILEVVARREMILGVVDLLMEADLALQEAAVAGALHLALAHAGQATILPVLGPEGLVTVQVVNPNALFGGH